MSKRLVTAYLLLAAVFTGAFAYALLSRSSAEPKRIVPAAPVAKNSQALASTKATGCRPLPTTLLGGRNLYTMILRIGGNLDGNSDVYGIDDILFYSRHKQMIRDHDVFMVNVWYAKPYKRDWRATLALLKRQFPCNRVLVLEGLGVLPLRSGYRAGLALQPGIWSFMIDFEPGQWEKTEEQKSQMVAGYYPQPWPEYSNQAAKEGISDITMEIARKRSAGFSPDALVGVTETFYPQTWNYADIASSLPGASPRRPGLQSVQTQLACKDGWMREATQRLWSQYGSRSRNNLAVQISFTQTPDPNEFWPMWSLPVASAAKCLQDAYEMGQRAFTFWASPEAMWEMLGRPEVCTIRRLC